MPKYLNASVHCLRVDGYKTRRDSNSERNSFNKRIARISHFNQSSNIFLSCDGYTFLEHLRESSTRKYASDTRMASKCFSFLKSTVEYPEYPKRLFIATCFTRSRSRPFRFTCQKPKLTRVFPVNPNPKTKRVLVRKARQRSSSMLSNVHDTLLKRQVYKRAFCRMQSVH